MIYNEPDKLSVGAVGSAYVRLFTDNIFDFIDFFQGQRYQIGPDFGLSIGARYPIGKNGGSFNLGGGISFVKQSLILVIFLMLYSTLYIGIQLFQTTMGNRCFSEYSFWSQKIIIFLFRFIS